MISAPVLKKKNSADYSSPSSQPNVPVSGMGLSLSRSIIEAHGGHIWVENNPDKVQPFTSICRQLVVIDAARGRHGDRRTRRHGDTEMGERTRG